MKVERLDALEILDSRGRPTVRATCTLAGGATGSASVPSGMSTGAAEAHELRDGDPARYGGLGCRRAVANVTGEITRALRGRTFATQSELDAALIELDGSPSKARLGANALLATSIAFARAAAAAEGVPLYLHAARQAGLEPRTLPRPTINLFSGGLHAGGQVAIQDVLVVPVAAPTIDAALATTYAVYQAAAALIARSYGSRPLTADEGGLAPLAPTVERMLEDAVAAIEAAGLRPGSEVALAVDVAATHFAAGDGRYRIGPDLLHAPLLVKRVAGWTRRFPIISVEDGLGEEDWEHWPALRAALAGRARTVGDDLLCTNPARIRRAIAVDAADTLLLKVNQIGTLSEAADAGRLARDAGWHVTVSARSGETEDDWLADLAVAWAADQIKIGSITQSERLAKYNRLLAIEAQTGLPLVRWPRADGVSAAAERRLEP